MKTETLSLIESVIETHQDAFVMLVKGNIQYMNPTAQMLLGYLGTNLLGKPFSTIEQDERYQAQRFPLPIEGLSAALVWVRDTHLKGTSTLLKRHLMHHDALTGLPNQQYFLKYLQESLKNASRRGGKLAVISVSLCWEEGLTGRKKSQALQQLINRYENVLREGDRLARYQEDMLTVLIEDIRVPADAAHVAQKLIDLSVKPLKLQDALVAVWVKLGIVIFPDSGQTVSDLCEQLKIADAKATKGEYVYMLPNMGKKESKQVLLDIQLHSALGKSEFSLQFHPIVHVKTGRVMALETLLRWENPMLGKVEPEAFIPILEYSGEIVSVGKWVIEESCRLFRNANLPHTIKLNINVSPLQLLESDFVEHFLSTLNENQLNPEEVVIEITESIAISENETIDKDIEKLRLKGVSFSIDDFGTGYSSLTALDRLPFQSLKLDKEFIKNIDKEESSAVLVNSVITMAKALGLKTIAEGVENSPQIDKLKSWGCDALQGYYIAEPLDMMDIPAFIKNCKKSF